MFRDLQELVERLRAHPDVVGLVRYGSRELSDLSPGGDFDLFVFLTDRPADVESLHFHVAGIPVDLNIRTLEDLQRREPLTNIDVALTHGQILHDPTSGLKSAIDTLPDRWGMEPRPLAESDIIMNRFCQTHALDKVRGRITDNPLLCEFLLSANIYWLVAACLRLREVPYPGEKHALLWLETNEPEIHQHIQAFFNETDLAEKLAIQERLTELVLAPVGGPWRKGEILAFGADENAIDSNQKGRDLFERLLGLPPGDNTGR